MILVMAPNCPLAEIGITDAHAFDDAFASARAPNSPILFTGVIEDNERAHDHAGHIDRLQSATTLQPPGTYSR